MKKKTLNSEIHNYLDLNSFVFWYWQGRVALYAILKAMGVKNGDEVILPAYTCVVVPNAIIYLGAKPVFVDIDPANFNMDVSKVEKNINKNTKVIICQNTYGLSSNLETLISIAKKNDLYTIEDCTHGFGGFYNEKPNGSYCDAAFYSTQWNKPFSTGVGGFAVTNNNFIKNELKKMEQEKLKPTIKDKVMLKVLYLVKNKLLNDITYWSFIRTYRFLSKHNIVLGSSKGGEIEGIERPEGYFKDFCDIQAKEGLKNIRPLKDILELRKKNANIYTDFLISKGKNHVPKELFKNHSFLKYPLLVKDRKQFLNLAEKNRISLGDWFLSPLHPAREEILYKWGFDKSKCPIAAELSSKVVNIPTDTKNIGKVIDFLGMNIKEVL